MVLKYIYSMGVKMSKTVWLYGYDYGSDLRGAERELGAKKKHLKVLNGGWGEIRTHGGRKPSTVFKTVAFNRSATHPSCANHYK